MNSFEKYYEDSPSYDSYRLTARDAYLAGLRRAVEIFRNTPVRSVVHEIEAEADEIAKIIR